MKKSIDDVNQNDLLKFWDFYATHVYKIDKEAGHHPSNVIANSKDTISEGILLKGLKMAINDMVSDSFIYSQNDVKKIDDFFIQHGVLTLTFMRKLFSKDFKKIVKAKKITNIEQYYLIKDILCDNSLELDDNERFDLGVMIEVFESESHKEIY